MKLVSTNPDTGLIELVGLLGELGFGGLIKAAATLLHAPLTEVHRALMPQGLLTRAGLLNIERQKPKPLHKKFELLEGVAEAVCGGAAEVKALLARWIPQAPAATLGLDDYPHLRREISLLRQILQASLHSRQPGVNVLLYGPPGTGKTELTRALAADLQVPLYTVPTEDAFGMPLAREQRLRQYLLAQAALARQGQALLVFDEIEDVFPQPTAIAMGQAEQTKGWINTILEDNRVPTLWVGNGIEALDAAYLRRFAQVIEVGIPPLTVRRRMIRTYTRGLRLSRAFQERLAAHPDLSPGLLRRAVDSLKLAQVTTPAKAEQSLAELLNAGLKALDQPTLTETNLPLLRYRPEYLNADHDLKALERGLRRNPQGRLCFYGPPGTGKSAYAAYLAKSLQRPLLVKRASDLLSPYVGETERHLAKAFRTARKDGAVLMLDEADSFLRDRRGAQASWEVSQVNELLVQLEEFRGLVITATNLFENLDTAALRRFDLKVRFDYLRPEQAAELFCATLRELGGPTLQAQSWQTQLAQLGRLTPGDFAAVLRRLRLLGDTPTPEVLLAALAAEVEASGRATGCGVGFMADL